MNNIIINSKINRDNLNQKFYLKSLIEEAYKVKLISNDNLVEVQTKAFNLLKKVIGMLTGNDSFTVKYDRAKDLLESSYLNIGVYLKTISNPDDAVCELLKSEWYDLYEKGNKIISDNLKKYEKFIFILKSNAIRIKNYSYINTIFKEIENFFNIYNKDFEAHYNDFDNFYPLLKCNPDLLGIEFIMEYMEKLNIENLFLQQFDEDTIQNVLDQVADYSGELDINILERFIMLMIGEELSLHQEYNFRIDILEIENIYMNFCNRNYDEIYLIIKSTLNKIYDKLKLNDKLKKYINDNLDYLVNLIELNARNDSLEVLFGFKKVIVED